MTVLFVPECFVGPVNASTGMAEVLREKGGHRCVFAVTGDWQSRLESLGFEVKLVGPAAVTTGSTDSADSNAKEVEEEGLLDDIDPLEKAIKCQDFIMNHFESFEATEPYLKTIIADLRPDLIITDHVLTAPSIVTSGIPWVFSWSSNPLSLDYGYEDKRLPPSCLGTTGAFKKTLFINF